MKKYTLAIFSIIFVATANAAPSVRTLGGAGTYNGTASAASAAKIGGVARAGSLRVTTKSGTATNISPSASATKSATRGRTASAPRLSIGKYLGHGTSVSGGASIKSDTPSSGGDMNPGVAADINSRLDGLDTRVGDVGTEIRDLRIDVDNLRDSVGSAGDFATREYVDNAVNARVDTSASASQDLGGTYNVTGTLNVPDQLLP